MAVFHDEVEIKDFQYVNNSEVYFYPCPRGNKFCITQEDLFTCREIVPASSTNNELVKC
ncbi:diphthamide biosynthesis protein 3-like [Ovis canadensis]|uniref:diphthamide biosynthesis protein 3-like n=1 Tax=Capricornis sumatraensis TaxID=34865 RepID=UPI0036043B5E